MDRALRLAREVVGSTSPNPAVGCVLVNGTGEILGQGQTQAAGGAHAEIMALRDARMRGKSVAGATAFVTLEPCSHWGRTGPCCDALVSAGIQKVVASIADPNPMVAGRGFQRLRAAGVEVQIGPGAEESRELNLGFFSRMVRKTPWIRVKVAASLDGKSALLNGQSQWITSEPARIDGHSWRARACAILTGIGTVLQDKPRLDVRLAKTSRQPALVLVDSRLQTPEDAPIFRATRALFIYSAVQDEERRRALEAAGATVVHMPGVRANGSPTGKVDLSRMLEDLGRREMNEVHVEAGHKLNGSLISENLVDEFLVYLAPMMLGDGANMASFGPLVDLSQAHRLQFKSTEMIGPDLRLLARVVGREKF
jgi:diaminohydroxyphosphoribosylaminopyrimidine deaminase / 5-amino-6-(5-phosphoribosylamino)uracil reductase